MGCSRLANLAGMTNEQEAKKVSSFGEPDSNGEKIKLSKEEIIERDMFSALKNNQFKVFYQSEHNTENGKIVGAEALVRWEHHELGQLKPDDFIPIFEKNGFIKKLDAFVRKQVYTDLQNWKLRGFNLVPIAINLSRIDFEDLELVDSIKELTREYAIAPELIRFEITETATIENEEIIARAINRLRDAGYKIELDDFGSGYSSLAMLSSVELDALKIDKSLLEHIKNDKKRRLIDVCIKLSKDLELKAAAEGVETKEQYDFLRESGCDKVQGFYFSTPLPADIFEKRLQGQD